MIIPQAYFQFDDMSVLMIAAGGQQAEIYFAKNGLVELIRSIKIPNPRYSDKEGQFKTRSGSGIVKSGGVYEEKTLVSVRMFLSEIKEIFTFLEKGNVALDKIILFAPSHVKNEIIQSIPKKFRSITELVKEGTHFGEPPLKLVKLFTVWQKRATPVRPMRREAKKIIDKSRKARRVIRKKTD